MDDIPETRKVGCRLTKADRIKVTGRQDKGTWAGVRSHSRSAPFQAWQVVGCDQQPVHHEKNIHTAEQKA